MKLINYRVIFSAFGVVLLPGVVFSDTSNSTSSNNNMAEVDIAHVATADLHTIDQNCVACHSRISQFDGRSFVEEASANELPANFANDCLQCHVENDVSARFIRVAQEPTEQSTPNEPDGSIKKFKKATGKGPGMSTTMYYEKSKLGDEPNQMVHVPAGEFVMGSNSRLPDEGPEHKASTRGFWIDKYEVTNFQYKKFIDATKRRSPNHFENRTFPKNKIDHPVTFVTWKDAKAYCKWAGKKLPSDKQWEKAARGTDARIYPWGNVYHTNKVNSPQRWQELKLQGDTTPVGAFEDGKSPYGAYDMSGNVWEWTSSWYQAYPGNTTPSETYGQTYKTLKGGSWWNCSFYKCGISAPTFNRSFFLRSTKNKSFGFRCAKDENA